MSEFALRLGPGIELAPELLETLRDAIQEQLTPPSRIVTEEVASEMFGVSTSTLREWRKRGCPFHKVEKPIYYDVDEVEDWIRSQ